MKLTPGTVHQHVIGIIWDDCDPAKVVYADRLPEKIRQMVGRERRNITA